MFTSKILHSNSIQFLLGHEDDPREIEIVPMQIWWGGGGGSGVKEVYYGICESGEWVNKHLKHIDKKIIIINYT